MNAIHTLSMKTAAAASRLAELEIKRDRGTGDGRVIPIAFRELQAAIEELRVAIESLQELSDGLTAARAQASATVAKYEEFRAVTPMAILFLDANRQIQDANDAAADLFNISARHLIGKPLLLFMVDRDQFLRVAKLQDSTTEPTVLDVTVRPRDRKARQVRAQVQFLPQHKQQVWFFSAVGSGYSPEGSDAGWGISSSPE